ncbi:hypothetical protein DFH07DRAFT_826233 [Mycena maculata]|uniref:DUF6533 domain-containing protein n=1 Tax=Mycena maculata TaxID=230809 RepID=A0AAD7IVS9_9AGAR|nr:hypothetical protein DFH07DRAFT_826233 [Mycena maculata]
MDDGGTSSTRALQLHNVLHIISINDEVRFLWRKAKTRSTYYFFLNRYLAAFGDVVITIFQFTAVPISLLLLINQCIVCILLALRIYALYGLDKRVYVGMMAAGAFLLAISCWALIRKGGDPDVKAVGCHIAIPPQLCVVFPPSPLSHQAIPWEALLVFDVLIFVALSHKTLQRRRESPMMWRRHPPILTLLIRDGMIMALLNLANILTFYVSAPPVVVLRADDMSVTLMSRLMLNLHAVDQTGIFSTTSRLDNSNPPYAGDDDRDGIELDTLRTQDLQRSAHAPGAAEP